jgi:hypothetical protein
MLVGDAVCQWSLGTRDHVNGYTASQLYVLLRRVLQGSELAKG